MTVAHVGYEAIRTIASTRNPQSVRCLFHNGTGLSSGSYVCVGGCFSPQALDSR